MEKKKYFEELNIFRALIIVWVVIGHSFDIEQSIFGFFHGYAYTFHMCAFFTLSGFLFTSTLKRCKSVKDSAIEAGKRAKRLLVPYFFFTAVSYMLKMFFEKYANNELSSNIIVDVLLGQNNPNGGIWFLYALFLISVVFIICNKINKFAVFAITVVLKIIIMITPVYIAPIAYFMSYAVYFSAGIVIRDYYDGINAFFAKFIKTKKSAFIALTIVLLGISAGISYVKIYILDNEFYNALVSVFNIILWYMIAHLINNLKAVKRMFMTIGDYGMDIYMVGYYVQIVIRVVLGSMLGAPLMIYSILMCVLGLILPIPLSKYIIRRVGIFRALALGDFSKKKRD